MTHRTARKREARRLDHAGQHPAAAHRMNSVARHVLAHEHHYALRGADTPDARVRMRRASEGAMQFARKRQIIDEATVAGQETLVLDPQDRFADHWISSRTKSRFS